MVPFSFVPRCSLLAPRPPRVTALHERSRFSSCKLLTPLDAVQLRVTGLTLPAVSRHATPSTCKQLPRPPLLPRGSSSCSVVLGCGCSTACRLVLPYRFPIPVFPGSLTLPFPGAFTAVYTVGSEATPCFPCFPSFVPLFFVVSGFFISVLLFLFRCSSLFSDAF